MKTKEEMADKCTEIIDSLDGFELIEKYRILRELMGSFLDTCKKNGIKILEFQEKKT